MLTKIKNTCATSFKALGLIIHGLGILSALTIASVAYVEYGKPVETLPPIIESPAQPVVSQGEEADMEPTSAEVNDHLIEGMILTESGGNKNAVSNKGACGLMQLMPATSKEVGVKHCRNAAENRAGGKRYFGKLMDKYRDETLALAAYNMGPGAVDRWLARGGKFNQLPAETQRYIAKVQTAAAVISWQTAQR